jgi:hypothetical protein
LISQSLICLRSCLEAIRKKNSGIITQYSHSYCSPNSRDCKVEYIATVNLHLQVYFNELSRVIFKKENILKKSLCYLAIFYSLCIQSIARKVLIMLISEESRALAQSKRYLHIPLRLFIASSGNLTLWLAICSHSQTSTMIMSRPDRRWDMGSGV